MRKIVIGFLCVLAVVTFLIGKIALQAFADPNFAPFCAALFLAFLNKTLSQQAYLASCRLETGQNVVYTFIIGHIAWANRAAVIGLVAWAILSEMHVEHGLVVFLTVIYSLYVTLRFASRIAKGTVF